MLGREFNWYIAFISSDNLSQKPSIDSHKFPVCSLFFPLSFAFGF
jgi:hypothetical protein